MRDKRIALITGGNQGVGLQVAKELVAKGLTVLVGSRNFSLRRQRRSRRCIRIQSRSLREIGQELKAD